MELEFEDEFEDEFDELLDEPFELEFEELFELELPATRTRSLSTLSIFVVAASPATPRASAIDRAPMDARAAPASVLTAINFLFMSASLFR